MMYVIGYVFIAYVICMAWNVLVDVLVDNI